jgi:probable O-glycosylation ligase (exosortase A-associated)
MVTNNTGLYESSIISCLAIAIIPLILFLAKHNSIFPLDWRVKVYSAALIFACLLIPVGTEARTGLVCIAVLAVLSLRYTKRRFLYLGLLGAAALIVPPLLPDNFTKRMDTIRTYKADSSAGTRLAVWAWTWEFAKDHPMGGGFEAFRQNKLRIETTKTEETGAHVDVDQSVQVDQARAYHSSYFEMLGEQGFPGLFLWLLIHGIGIIRMEILHRRYRNRAVDDDRWIGSLAGALQQGHLIYLVGSLFVGIAFQPFVYLLVGMQIGLDTYAKRRAEEAVATPMVTSRTAAAR